MNTELALVAPELPNITYSVEFPNRKTLSDATEYFANPLTGESFLEEETKWEAKLDEADKIDCMVAVASGVITGLLDSFFVGEFSLERANEWGSEKVNAFVIKVARFSGYTGDDLEGAIEHLEETFKFASDGVTAEFGGGLQHHLRDFSHHFSVAGLLCSLFTQFTGKVIGTDASGAIQITDVPESHQKYLGKTVPEKVVFGTILWFMHIASDMAGSSATAGAGTGVPGPIISLLKRLSALPLFRKNDGVSSSGGIDDITFSQFISKLFNGTLLAERDEAGKVVNARRFDFRTEIGIMHELGRQGIPVLLNQCFIRSFYFVRRLIQEIEVLAIRSFADLKTIDPQDVLPFRNKVIARMSTIASGVFTAVDLSDAAIRAVIVSKGSGAAFLAEFIVRVNFVGVATFAVACALDVREIIKGHAENAGPDEVNMFEHELSKFACLELGDRQIRLLQSLQRAMVLHDIKETMHSRKKEAKRLWLEEWEGTIEKGLEESGATLSMYLLDPDVLYVEFNKLVRENPSDPWPFLLTLEADLFTPYQPLSSSDRNKFRGLKFESDYMLDVFAACQIVVSRDDIRSLRKSMKRAERDIDSRFIKTTLKLVGSAAVVVVATGAAFVFAPLIAPLIAGEAVAGLSGAALTSASLAFVGGGSLAAGGLGMAGGTAIIAGGGALVGSVGSTGASAIITAITNADGYVYAEASKLLCFSRAVLLERYADIDSVRRIIAALNEHILNIEIQQRTLEEGEGVPVVLDARIAGESDVVNTADTVKVNPKKQFKVIRKSLKYLRRCNDELAKGTASIAGTEKWLSQ